MPLIQDSTSIAAGAIVSLMDNLGTVWRIADRNYWGRLAATADAAQAVRLLVQIGPRVHLEESKISAANRVPILPDDLVISQFPIPRGAYIILRARNTGGAANTIFWQLNLQPAGG